MFRMRSAAKRVEPGRKVRAGLIFEISLAHSFLLQPVTYIFSLDLERTTLYAALYPEPA